MTSLTPELFLTTLALVGVVIVISALLSGLIERSGLPHMAVFLGLGALIGGPGLGLLDIDLGSPILQVVATLSLALVLFTDAVTLSPKEVRSHKVLAFLLVGPITLLTAAGVAVIAWQLLDLPLPYAVILGAGLASTDPVLLRSLVRAPGLDPTVREGLRLEGGFNDAVLLPLVLISMEILSRPARLDAGDWALVIVRMFVLSPAAGALVALGAIWALEFVRKRVGVRRDYEAIYSLGIAFVAFAAAESVHGSGFVAAFAAGLMIASLDVELCDCFLEYGESTAEMLLLFAFVLFGTSIIWSGLSVIGPGTLLFTASVLLFRPLVALPILARLRLSWRNRFILGWFGPRGLSSLLLVLLPVFAGLPDSARPLTICCLVVLCSVVVHGLSAMFLIRTHADAGQPHDTADSITADEVKARLAHAEPVVLVDARAERSYANSTVSIEGAVRLRPSDAVREAERLKLPKKMPVAVFCD